MDVHSWVSAAQSKGFGAMTFGFSLHLKKPVLRFIRWGGGRGRRQRSGAKVWAL